MSDRIARALPLWLRFLAAVFIAACLAQLLPAEPGFAAEKKAKYIFFLVGDGMGLGQRYIASAYLAAVKGGTPTDHHLAADAFPVQGLAATYSADAEVTDSAAAITALMAGVKTTNQALGVDAQNRSVELLTEFFKREGYKVGAVSSVSLDHATPAGTYAHIPDRRAYPAIAAQAATANLDLLAGGGFKAVEKMGPEAVAKRFADAGWKILNATEFLAAGPYSGKILFNHPKLQEEQAMHYALDAPNLKPDLADITRKSAEILDNPTGFFLLVEGGKIDWACHANDPRTVVEDVLAFDAAVAQALAFAAKKPDETLVVVAADHETGGMSVGARSTRYRTHLDRLKHQKGSYVAFAAAYQQLKDRNAPFEEALTLAADFYGFDLATPAEAVRVPEGGVHSGVGLRLFPYERDELAEAFQKSQRFTPKKLPESPKDAVEFGDNDPYPQAVLAVLNRKAGIGWTNSAHTAAPTPVSAYGPGDHHFAGFYDNTTIPRRFKAAAAGAGVGVGEGTSSPHTPLSGRRPEPGRGVRSHIPGERASSLPQPPSQ